MSGRGLGLLFSLMSQVDIKKCQQSQIRDNGLISPENKTARASYCTYYFQQPSISRLEVAETANAGHRRQYGCTQ